jgi:hypothetical protein
MGRECDNCGQDDYTADNPRVFVCQPRPSDPAEMCCTVAGHKGCFTSFGDTLPSIDKSGGTATADQWNDWIESDEARKAGFMWISL